MDVHKSKKMVATEKEIADLDMKRGEFINRVDTLNKYQPETAAGKKARGDSLDRLQAQRDNVNNELKTLRERLEVETVAFVSGDDTDIFEPTPREGLERAS